jgi:acetyl-CoA carboxylase carboxyltransferase component
VPFGRLTHADDPRRADETFGDGELCGFGKVEGRWISYFASDPRVKGASGGPAGRRHSQAFRNLVERAALPLFFVMQGGGARIDEAMTSAFISFPGTGMGARKVFERRGVLLTIVLGAYYAPWNVAQADFSVMTETSNISLTSPPLVRVGTGQEVTPEELGGAELQATRRSPWLAERSRTCRATLVERPRRLVSVTRPTGCVRNCATSSRRSSTARTTSVTSSAWWPIGTASSSTHRGSPATS